MYILIAIIALAILLTILVYKKKTKMPSKLTPLTGFAFAFIIAGIVFGQNRLLGYSLMGIGILLSIIDIFSNLKKK